MFTSADVFLAKGIFLLPPHPGGFMDLNFSSFAAQISCLSFCSSRDVCILVKEEKSPCIFSFTSGQELNDDYFGNCLKGILIFFPFYFQKDFYFLNRKRFFLFSKLSGHYSECWSFISCFLTIFVFFPLLPSYWVYFYAVVIVVCHVAAVFTLLPNQ